MLLRRIYDDTLAQASYLIGCQETGAALVVDPNRDVEQYVAAAAADRLRITHVTETHIHADFVSGAAELARQTGARLLLSGEGGPGWDYAFAGTTGATLLTDGYHFDVGTVQVEVQHTPGHTPEHLSFLITDTPTSNRPVGILTGDFVFVGDVGRPDLLERAAGVTGTMDDMARLLFRSIQRLRTLPDYLQLWPGHGAGSACGKALGAVPSTTLGYERIANWAFQPTDENEFVRTVLDGQGAPPRYFARMKQVNRDGPTPWPTSSVFPRLAPAAVFDAISEHVSVVDIRKTADFAAGHIRGTLNIPLGTAFTKWGGSLLPDDASIVLIDDAHSPSSVERARHTLALIGIDRVIGWAGREVFDAWTQAERPLESTPQLSIDDLADTTGRVIDVRDDYEWQSGHMPDATHLVLTTLPQTLTSLEKDRPIILSCQGGSRSAIAASLLRARGFTNVSNLVGGMSAWTAAGKPVVSTN